MSTKLSKLAHKGRWPEEGVDFDPWFVETCSALVTALPPSGDPVHHARCLRIVTGMNMGLWVAISTVTQILAHACSRIDVQVWFMHLSPEWHLFRNSGTSIHCRCGVTAPAADAKSYSTVRSIRQLAIDPGPSRRHPRK